MRPVSPVLFALAFLALPGCESQLTEAKIVQMVRDREAAKASGKVWVPPNSSADQVEVPGSDGRNVQLGSSEDEATRAQSDLSMDEGSSIERLSRELTRSYLSDVRSGSASQWAAIEERNSKRMLDALLSVEGAFLSHASLVGPLWGTVAFSVAFPDPDPNSLREPPSYDFIGRQDFARAADARNRIRSLDSSYRSIYDRTLEQANQNLRAERTSWLKSQIEAEDEARQRADRDARSMVSSSLGQTRPSIYPPVVAMPPTSGDRIGIAGVRPESPDWRVRPGAEWGAGAREQQRIQVYSDIYGYRPDPRVGTDVTSDFRSWQQRRGFGR